MSKLDLKIAEAEKVLKSLENKKKAAKSSKVIKCAHCSEPCRIKDIDLIDVQYYVEPYSCTGGDYWCHSEYNYICSQCNVRNRLMFNNTQVKYDDRKYHSPEKYFFNEYLYLFKSSTEECKKGSGGRFVNNNFVQDNLKKFIDKEKIKELETHYGR